jgi:hypothetical protein
VSKRDQTGGTDFHGEPLCFGSLAVALFALALWFYNNSPRSDLLLDLAPAVPMVWAVLAARDANDPDTPLRRFVLRIGHGSLGTGMLGMFWWSVDQPSA